VNLPPLKPIPPQDPGDDDIRIIEPLCAVFRRKLKSEGLKYTPERAYILDAIMRRAMEADAAASEPAKPNGSPFASAAAPASRPGSKGPGKMSGKMSGKTGQGPTGVRKGGVFEAEELVEAMRKQGFRVSRATVYRTIKLLAEAGIIQQVLFDTDQAHYQLAYGRASSGLLVNVDTNEITPIDVPELAAIRDRICRERGLVAEGHRLVIYGRRQ
jgi:Fur family ferric uptake transcriptional regulator